MRRRCNDTHWLHQWRLTGHLGLACLTEVYVCARCGTSKRVQVYP